MENLIKYLFISLTLLLLSSCLDDPIRSDNKEKSIYSAKLINGKVWVCGNEGLTAQSQDGINFIKSPSNTNTYLDIAGFGTNLWRCGGNGRIEYSSNNGSSWETQNTGTIKYIKSIQFLDDNIGYAVGQKGLLISTTDGGKTWLNKSFSETYDLNKIKFLNNNFGIISAWNRNGAVATIYVTKNAGLTFDTIYPGANNYFSDIFIASEKEFYLAAAKEIYRTKDSGQSFGVITDLPVVNSDELDSPSTIESIQVIGNDMYFAGYFGHNLGRIYKLDMTNNSTTLLYNGDKLISCSALIVQNQNLISYGGYGYKVLYKNINDAQAVWNLKAIE